MGFFSNLGNRAERFRQSVREAAAESYECADCGSEFHADYDACPECGSDAVEHVE